jgi:hypothetical protein
MLWSMASLVNIPEQYDDPKNAIFAVVQACQKC